MAVDWDKLVLGPLHAAFGEAEGSVSYRPQTGAEFILEGGVFDAGFLTVDPLMGPPVSSVQPTLGVRLSLFPAGVEPLQGDQVTINGATAQRLYRVPSKTFRVKDVQPDSHGEARLLLNAA